MKTSSLVYEKDTKEPLLGGEEEYKEVKVIETSEIVRTEVIPAPPEEDQVVKNELIMEKQSVQV